MGNVANIDKDTFPQQGKYLGKRVKVAFHYDTQHLIGGVVVRNDVEAPFVEIIKLDDDRYVLTTECQWTTDTTDVREGPREVLVVQIDGDA